MMWSLEGFVVFKRNHLEGFDKQGRSNPRVMEYVNALAEQPTRFMHIRVWESGCSSPPLTSAITIMRRSDIYP